MAGFLKLARLCPSSTVFMECDIQQKIGKHMHKSDTMTHNARRLTQVSEILDIPIIATRHVQANFGEIDARINDVTHEGRKIFDKSQFSMLEAPVFEYLQSLKNPETNASRKEVVLYGCETHICVRQTAFDLLARDYNVHLVVDAISSINTHDRHVGFASMREAGAQLITFQSLIFEMLRDFNHPKFKAFMPILKDNPKNADGNIEHLDLSDAKL